MTPQQPQKIIEARGITKTFGDRAIFQNLDISVKKGEILLILGVSGSGKSVLLKTLLGLLKLDGGEIRFRDKIILECPTIHDQIFPNTQKHTHLTVNSTDIRKNHTEFLQSIGILFQSNALFDSMTNGENIAFPLRDADYKTKQQTNEKIDELLRDLGLKVEDKLKLPSEISGGMQKRVALARALIQKPELIFLDEPTSGLDVLNSKIIFDLVKEVNNLQGTTTVIISHDITYSTKIADNIKLLFAGKLYDIDKVSDIFTQIEEICKI